MLQWMLDDFLADKAETWSNIDEKDTENAIDGTCEQSGCLWQTLEEKGQLESESGSLVDFVLLNRYILKTTACSQLQIRCIVGLFVINCIVGPFALNLYCWSFYYK